MKSIKTTNIIYQRCFIAALIILLFYAVHFLQINDSGVGLLLPFNAAAWIPLSFCIGIGMLYIAQNQKIIYSPLTVKLFLCIALLFVPFIFGNDLTRNVNDRFLGLIAGFLLLISLQQFMRDESKKIVLLQLIFISFCIEVLLGWNQYFQSQGISFLGNEGRYSGPITGIFQQRNVFASFVAFGIVLSAYILSSVLKRESIYKISLLPYFIVPLVSVHMLNVTTSRTGWLGMIIGVLFIIPKLYKSTGIKVCGSWILCLLVGIALSWQISTNISSGSPGFTSAKLNINSLRSEQFANSLEQFLERPVTGYGYGRFESSYLNHTAQKYANGELEVLDAKPLIHPHNELLFWAVEGGVIALMALLMAAWWVWKRVYQRNIYERFALIALFFPIVLHTQLEFPFYVSVLHWFIFICLIFIADNSESHLKEKEVKFTLILWLGGILTPLLTTAFMVTSIRSGLLYTRFESGLNSDVNALTGITNPIVYSERINWAMRSRLVVNGIINSQPEQIQPFIDWAPELLESKPRATFYKYLILAYQGVGDEENMRRIQQEASFLFPNDSFIVEEFANSLLRQVPFETVSGNL